MRLQKTLIVVLLGLVGAALSAAACSSGSNGSTTGKRISLETRMTADLGDSATFTTGFGWDVVLTRAVVASSGFYYFDGPPPTALLDPPRPSLRERLLGLVESTAWAHPGHYQAGNALGQVLFDEPIALDLFAKGPVELPTGEGVTGTYRSARFVIAPEPPGSDVLNGHVAVAEGTAVEHDGSSDGPIHFRLVADYADVSMSVNNGAVDGCVLDETDVTSDGSITLEIAPQIWLNLVDFSKLDPGSEQEPTEAHDPGFSQGVAELSAYHFSYSED
jgi:hypothetical protein